MGNNLEEVEHLLLIDGSGFIFRAYHALPQLAKSDGTPTGAVAGYCNMLFKILNEYKFTTKSPFGSSFKAYFQKYLLCSLMLQHPSFQDS